MGNIETMTKSSRLKSVSSIESNYSFTLVIYLFSDVSLQLHITTKKNYYPLLWRKHSSKLDLRKSEFLKGPF